MSVTKVQGKDVRLFIFNIDGNYDYYCGQSISLNIDTEQLPSTNISSAGFRAFQPGKTQWDITFNGVTMIKDNADGNFITFDLTTEQIRRNGVDIFLLFTNENGNTESFSGHANIASNQFTGETGSLSKFTTRFQGTGGFQRNQSVSQNKTNDVKSFYYTATGVEPNYFIDATLSNKTILAVFRPVPIVIVYSPVTPLTGQVEYIPSNGEFIFGSSLSAGELITIFYI